MRGGQKAQPFDRPLDGRVRFHFGDEAMCDITSGMTGALLLFIVGIDVVVVGAGLLKTLLWICVSSFPSSRPNPKETAIAPSNDA